MHVETANSSSQAKRRPTSCLFVFLWCFAMILVLFGVAQGPIYIGPLPNYSSQWAHYAHALYLAMYSYANDNEQNYPDGKSSTEVFQKLLDGGYVSDPSIFYIPLPGKIPPVPGQKILKPENVSWDVTSGATTSCPADLPIVFMTGYRVTYAPGASLETQIKPYPRYDQIQRSWSDWWKNRGLTPDKFTPPLGIAFASLSNQTMFVPLDLQAHPDGSIPNFIPATFKPDGKTYRQLTPDGPLP